MLVRLSNNKVWVEPWPAVDRFIANNWLVEKYLQYKEKELNEIVDALILFAKEPETVVAFYKVCLKYKVVFKLVENESVDYLCFDPSQGATIVPIQISTLEKLCNDNTFKTEYSKILKAKLVHEHTHKQQFERYEGYNKKYKLPSFMQSFTLNSQADIDYFSQTIEADAYGREVGEILRQNYKKLSASEVFDKVLQKELPEDLEEYIDVYRDSRISKKAFKHFWKSLYEYLVEVDKEKYKDVAHRLNEVYKLLVKNSKTNF